MIPLVWDKFARGVFSVDFPPGTKLSESLVAEAKMIANNPKAFFCTCCGNTSQGLIGTLHPDPGPLTRGLEELHTRIFFFSVCPPCSRDARTLEEIELHLLERELVQAHQIDSPYLNIH